MKRIGMTVMLLFVASASATRLTVSMTSYNSIVGQTDSTPFITATGTRTRFGVAAASPNLIRRFGFGSVVRIVRYEGGRGCGKTIPIGTTFRIEDSTASSKVNTVDLWLPSRSASLQFGRCRAVVDIMPG